VQSACAADAAHRRPPPIVWTMRFCQKFDKARCERQGGRHWPPQRRLVRTRDPITPKASKALEPSSPPNADFFCMVLGDCVAVSATGL